MPPPEISVYDFQKQSLARYIAYNPRSACKPCIYRSDVESIILDRFFAPCIPPTPQVILVAHNLYTYFLCIPLFF